MKKRSIFLRAVSLAVSLIFAGNTAVWSAPAEKAAVLNSGGLTFEIPSDWGTIEEVYSPRQTASGSPLIIHIRDAHSQPEAQLHIEKILRYLSLEKKINAVAVEAGFGKTDPSILNLLPDSEANKAAARNLLEMGELSGAAYYAASFPENANVYGVEDEDLYKESLEIFKKLKSAENKIEPPLKNYQTVLEESEAAIFPEELKTYVIKKRAWENRHDLSADYFLFLNTLTEKYLGFSFSDASYQARWPYLIRLIKAGELEQTLDLETARKEASALSEQISSSGTPGADYLAAGIRVLAESREPFEQWMEKNPYQGSASSRYFFEALWRAAREQGISIVAYPQFLKLGGLAVLRQEIQPDLLFKEAASIEELLEKKLAVSAAEKELFELGKDTALISKLLRLQMSREDYGVFLEKKQNLSSSAMTKRFRKISSKDQLEPLSAGLLKDAERFYVLSLKRDQTLIDNTLRFAGSKPAVLIAGGFHSEGLTQILKSRSIPFISVLPKMTRVEDESLYEKAMMGSNADLKPLFSGTAALGILELINRPEVYSRVSGTEKQKNLLLRAFFTSGTQKLLEKGWASEEIYTALQNGMSAHPEVFGNSVTWHRNVPVQVSAGKKSADLIRVHNPILGTDEIFMITSAGLIEAKPAIRLPEAEQNRVSRSELRALSRRNVLVFSGIAAVAAVSGLTWGIYQWGKDGESPAGRARHFDVDVPEKFSPNYKTPVTYSFEELRTLQIAVLQKVESQIGEPFDPEKKEHVQALAGFYKLTEEIKETDGFSPVLTDADAAWWAGLTPIRKTSAQQLSEIFFWRWQAREVIYWYGSSVKTQGQISALAERAQWNRSIEPILFENFTKGKRNLEAPETKKRSELRLGENPVSIQGLTPEEKLTALIDFYARVRKEKEQKGAGDLIEVIAVSDPHADISRFLPLILEPIRRALPEITIPDDFKYDRKRPFFDQLAEFGVKPEMLKNKIFYHNLGDVPDRGKDAAKVAGISEDLIDADLSDFIIGNHDLWAFLNLFGFHLPWYPGFKFYGYSDTYDKANLALKVDNLIRRAHTEMPETSGESAKSWWAKRLAEYIEFYAVIQKERWNKLYEERVNGDPNPADSTKRIEGTGLNALVNELFKADKALKKDEQKYKKFRDLWSQLRGRNISDTEIYTGVRAVGTVSVQWWRELLESFIQLKDDPALAEQPGLKEAWEKAIAMMKDEIIPETAGLLDDKLKEKSDEDPKGKWWWRIFEAINYKNYTSVEWWARDWSSHKDWGTAVLEEINEEITEENKLITDPDKKIPLLTQANYLDHPALQKMGAFFRKNFNLYIRDKYQDVYLHAFLPVDGKTGEFYFKYRNVEYRGKGNLEKGIPSVWDGLIKIGEDVRNPELTPLDLYEALNLVNSWYADNTTIAKAAHVISAFQKFGVKGMGEINGYARLFNGHIPAVDYLKQVKEGQTSFITGFNTENGFFNTDQGAALKFGGRGGFVVIGPDGIYLVGYTHKGSREITNNPHTLSDDGTKILFENKGIEREEFLDILTGDLQEAIFELAALPMVKMTDGTFWSPLELGAEENGKLSAVVPADVSAKLPSGGNTGPFPADSIRAGLAQAGYEPQDYEISQFEITPGELGFKIVFNNLRVKNRVSPARSELRLVGKEDEKTALNMAQPADTGISVKTGEESLINQRLERLFSGRRISAVLGVSGRVTQKVLDVSDLQVQDLWPYAQNVFGFAGTDGAALTPEFSAAFLPRAGSAAQSGFTAPRTGIAPRIVVLLGDTELSEADLKSMQLVSGSQVIVIDKPGEDTAIWNRYAHVRLGASGDIRPKRVSMNETDVYDHLENLFKKFPESVPVLVLPSGTPHEVLGAYEKTASQDGFVVASPRGAQARLALFALTGRVKPSLLRQQVPDDLVAFKFYSNALSPVSIQPGAENRFAQWAFAAAMQQRFAASA